MVDADLTYDFREIPRFVQELEDGAELVVGNRMGGLQPGAMPWLSRVGNPILSGFLNALHRTNVARRALRHARGAAERPPGAQPPHGRAWSSHRRW